LTQEDHFLNFISNENSLSIRPFYSIFPSISLPKSPISLFSSPITLQIATLYVDETSKAKNPSGSQDHPFHSLDDAALNLKLGTVNIILLGQSITITSQVIFPEGSICTIKYEKL